jgi:methylthioxylose transferase
MTLTRKLSLAAVVAVAAAIIGFGFVEGNRFSRREIRIRLGAGPLVGDYLMRVGWRTLPVVVCAVVIVVWGPRIAGTLRLRWLALSTAVSTTVFTVLLAATDNRQQMLEPVVNKTEYWQALATAAPPGEFIDTYVERLPGYSVHLRGHPPGFTALLLAGREAGMTSPWLVATLCWVAAGVAAGAVVIAVWRLAGARPARTIAPFLCVAPYAVWAGTSADAVYMAVAAGGVALLTWAATGEQSARRRWLWAASAGAVFGMLIFGTYGGALIAPVAAAVVVATRRWSLVAPALLAMATVVALWALAGFWWFDGVAATRKEYWAGTAQFREPWRFAVFNVAALLIAVGPVAVVGLAMLRRARWVWFVGGAMLAVAISNASQYTKGEVERIWLLFMPWLTVAALGVAASRRWAVVALGVQAATAIVIQSVLSTKW